MRLKLNLNRPGTKMIAAVGAFLCVIPTILYAVSLFLRLAQIDFGAIDRLIRFSVDIGFALGVILLVLLIVEQIQDHYLNVVYFRNRNRKVALSDGYYECQYCGNRKVGASSKYCLVCGKPLL
jgi:hypothetical protein